MSALHWHPGSTLVDALRQVADLGTEIRRVRRAPGRPGIHQFVHTPMALIDSWTEAFRLETATAPGDVVVIGDRSGLAGVFALGEAMKPRAQQRLTVLVAGESELLRHLWITGTLEGPTADAQSTVDWEIAALRHASRVVTPSGIAADLLRRFGIRSDVSVIAIARDRRQRAALRPSLAVWLPEPPSRLAQTAKILRALSDSVVGPPIVICPSSAPDRLWKGSTLDTARQSMEMLEERLEIRRTAPDHPGLVVLGDPFAIPSREVAVLRDRGVAIAVPESSTAASLWPESFRWSTEEDLAAIVAGKAVSSPIGPLPSIAEALEVEGGESDLSRARAVSVGVPVFRDVRFLDECVGSILAQTQPAAELLLIDDGSNSSEVTSVLEGWARREPGRIRVLRQPNRGVCVARNTMLDAMTGDAFLLVDVDDVLDSGFIEKTADALRANPGLDAIATWTTFFGTYQGVEAKPPFDARVGRRENPIISTCVLVDMAVRDRGLRFSPDLAFIYCEDWDFWAQIVAEGGRFGLVPEPLVRHRVHGSSGANARSEEAHAIGKARATSRLPSLSPHAG